VADFGVARFLIQGGVMTAETGTYRWMAPEVCYLKLKIVMLFHVLISCGTVEVLCNVKPVVLVHD